MTDIAENSFPPLIDDLSAPVTFASVAAGFFVLDGNITITFETARSNYSTNPPVVNRVTVARLVMPIGGAQNLVAGLNDFLIQNDLDPSKAIMGDAKPN